MRFFFFFFQDFCAGTAEFMSPEVLLSEDYGLPSDVFSLGIIFVEMLTGREPSPSFPERPPQVRPPYFLNLVGTFCVIYSASLLLFCSVVSSVLRRFLLVRLWPSTGVRPLTTYLVPRIIHV